MLFVSTSLTRLWTHHGRALISPSAGSQLHESFIRRRKCWRGSVSQRLRSRWCHTLSVTLHHDSLGCFHSHTRRKLGRKKSKIFPGVYADDSHGVKSGTLGKHLVNMTILFVILRCCSSIRWHSAAKLNMIRTSCGISSDILQTKYSICQLIKGLAHNRWSAEQPKQLSHSVLVDWIM